MVRRCKPITVSRIRITATPVLFTYDRLSLAQTTRPFPSGVTKPVRNLAPVASDLSATREHAASRYRLGRMCTLQSDLCHDSLRFLAFNCLRAGGIDVASPPVVKW